MTFTSFILRRLLICVKNTHFFDEESISVILRSPQNNFKASPGKPEPVPTSTIFEFFLMKGNIVNASKKRYISISETFSGESSTFISDRYFFISKFSDMQILYQIIYKISLKISTMKNNN